MCRLLDLVDPGHCAKQPQVQDLQDRADRLWDLGGLTRGLDPTMVGALNDLARLSRDQGLPDPLGRIISGYRDRTTQLYLQREWDQGRREGLAVRPASPDTSRHCRGRAVDLRGTNNELHAWGRLWESLGHRWGGRFFPKPDLPHYDII